MGVRKIIHADMDVFYASVEQRDDPRLKGKPVFCRMEGQSLSCVRGIVRGESLRRAFCNASEAGRAPVSDATFVAPNFTRYRAVSREVREIFNRHTDLIEPLSFDETCLDVTTSKTGLPTVRNRSWCLPFDRDRMSVICPVTLTYTLDRLWRCESSTHLRSQFPMT